ncbi:hypothetical protein A2U01_0069390, partial [Trifolium medium]|nr:hypothetical protein [Trifolium medium]
IMAAARTNAQIVEALASYSDQHRG